MIQFKTNGKEFSTNLIPYNGEAYYLENFLESKLARQYFIAIRDRISWEQDEFLMYGKKIITNRRVAWYGSKPFDYSYSGITRKAKMWTRELKEIKQLIEIESKDIFNSCLLNLYFDGTDGMGWHSDNEKELLPNATIASVSLGSERKFSFKHKTTKQTISLTLSNGSLLLMKGEIQKHWLHQMPKTKKIIGPRINLTYRSIFEDKERP